MNRKLSILASIVALIAVPPIASAQVYVDKFRPGLPGCPADGWTWESTHAAGLLNDIVINVDNCTTAIRIYAANPYLQDIGRITINGGGYLDSITIATPAAGPTVPGGRSFRGIHISNSSVRDDAYVSGWLTGDLTGGIDVGRFGLVVDGAVQAPLRSRTTGSSYLDAGSTTSAGTLLADQGNFSTIVIDGTVAGTITASAGRIETITCASLQANVMANTASNRGIDQITVSGNIGSSSNTVNITAVGDIPVVSAANAWANINVTGAGRQMKRIQTTGNFTGSISAHSMEYATSTDPGGASGILIGGTLDADVTFASYAAAPLHDIGSIPAGRTFSIGGGWYDPRIIEIGTLAGQVILNATNNPLLAWTGPVKVDGTTLSPTPDYTNLSSSLGGGAVGFVPFDIHRLESYPPHGSSLFFYSTMTVSLSFYGPVTWSGTQSPVLVEWDPYGNGQWIALPSSDFVVWQSSDRQIEVTAVTPSDFQAGSHYRITPVAGVLKCDLVAGSPDVEDFEYILYGD